MLVRTAVLLVVAAFLRPIPAQAEICSGLQRPVDGHVLAEFAPQGAYAGHWGIDLGAEPQTIVRAPSAGIVTFAGMVAGNRTVTVDHGGGIRTTNSYLHEIRVGRGAQVRAGQTLGTSGTAHGESAVHLSVRVDGRYVDPMRYLGCHPLDITRGLRLVPSA